MTLTFPIWGSIVCLRGRCSLNGDPGSPPVSATCPRLRTWEGESECADRRRIRAPFRRRGVRSPHAERTRQDRSLTVIGKRTMSDLQEISRVIYHHDWTSIDQWVSNLGVLADLTDDEIVEVERLGKRRSPGSRKFGDRQSALRRVSQGRRSSSGFWARTLTSLRRGCSILSLF